MPTYVKNAREIERAVRGMGRGFDKSRVPVERIFKEELSKLLPAVRRQVSKDTGLLRRSLAVKIDARNFTVTAGYRITQGRFRSRRVPAILEEFGGPVAGPPRTRALTRAFAKDSQALANRLIAKARVLIVRAMRNAN